MEALILELIMNNMAVDIGLEKPTEKKSKKSSRN